MFNPEINKKTPEQLRNEYEERIKKIAEEKGIEPMDIVKGDALNEKFAREGDGQRGWRSDMKEKVANSDLILAYSEKGNPILKGDIDGKNVEIEVILKPKSGSVLEVLKSTIDGKPLTKDEATDIFYEYEKIAAARSSRIDNLEIAKEDEKKLQSIREKIDSL